MTHIGRNWVAPDPFAPECGCTPLPCGLVSQQEADEKECDQHSMIAGRTLRTVHEAAACNG